MSEHAAENDTWSCYLCGSSSPHVHGPDTDVMSSVIPPENDVPDGELFAWTPDDAMERGVEEFRRHWPEMWEAWLSWCDSEASQAPRPTSPEGTAR